VAQGGADKEQVIEAVVLAFSYSEMSSVVGTDALASVLRVEYHDMVSNGTLDMEVLWELIEEQPGFDRASAIPPLAQLHSWRDKLGLEVELPAAMEEMSDKELAIAAAGCKVPAAEVRLLFRLQTGETGGSGRDTGRSRRDSVSPRSRRDSVSPRSKRDSMAPVSNVSGSHDPVAPAAKKRPAWLGIVAAVVALGAFGFVGATLYGSCGEPTPSFEEFNASRLPDLPATGADRLGSQLRVTVDPAGWSKLGRDARQKKLETSLMKLADQGISAISVQQGDRVVATAARRGGGGVKVWLRP
jgi:hypothetical protein